MKSIVVSIAVAAGLMIAGSAMAAELPKDAKKCASCHSLDSAKKLVGPGWVAIGQKYAGKADAAKTIAANITAGGKFGWNNGNMPAKGGNAKLSDADVAAIAEHIAGLK